MTAHPCASLIVLGSVALLQLVNEALDAADWIGWTGQVNWTEAVKDTTYTLGLPSATVLIGADDKSLTAINKNRDHD